MNPGMFSSGVLSVLSVLILGSGPFATTLVDYDPAPGQFVNNNSFNDPLEVLGAPGGGGVSQPPNDSLVTLGGFGGAVILGFDHTVMDDPDNPYGIDAVVYGNAFYLSGNPARRWAEAGVIEISKDVNVNGIADDPWYLIPGSHISSPSTQYEVATWDDDTADATYPPAYASWIPSGLSGIWTTATYRLPPLFETVLLVNPNGADAVAEGTWGYADCSPTAILGDLDHDGFVDDPDILASEFYTRPDNPYVTGLTPRSGGGDGFDISSAVDPQTHLPAGLDGFDFMRITTGVNYVNLATGTGEISTELDAVADVAPLVDCNNNGLPDVDETQQDCNNNGIPDECEGSGDATRDCRVTLDDFDLFFDCLSNPGDPYPLGLRCAYLDADGDLDVDFADYAAFQTLMGSVHEYCADPMPPCSGAGYVPITVMSNHCHDIKILLDRNPFWESESLIQAAGRTFYYDQVLTVTVTFAGLSRATTGPCTCPLPRSKSVDGLPKQISSPQCASIHPQRPFLYWSIDGVPQEAFQESIVIQTGSPHTIEAVFQNPALPE